MERTTKPTSHYLVREFARRSGVTIRTLHHYDHLGILRPSVLSEAGYRLYSEEDFARLQQIVTLKFIGFSLKQIRELLEGELYDLESMLRFQRTVMEEKRKTLDTAIRALDTAERIAATGRMPGWELFKHIVEVITMENNAEWLKKYYTEEQLADIATRDTPEIRGKGEQEWAILIREVEESLNEEPTGEKGRELASRWQALIDAFTGGSPEIRESLNKLYADKENWPATFRKPYSDEVEAWIGKAMKGLKGE